MKTRRDRNQAVRRPLRVQQGGIVRPVSAISKLRLGLWICGAVFMGAYLFSRFDTPKNSTAASQADAKVVGVETSSIPKTAQAPFPTVNTKGFTRTQLDMLEFMKKEYAKQPTSFDRTVLEYTEGAKESWCADFISVIRFEAGKPFVNQETGYWRIPGVQTLRDYYARSDAYHFVGTYIPKFGDVAFYFGETPDGGSREHVAFVLEVRGDTLVTLGGNETAKGILQVRYDKMTEGVKGLAGFGESSL